MASIIRRGKSWRAMIVKKGERFSATFDTKAEAKDWVLQLESSLLRGSDEKRAEKISLTMADLLDRYAKEVSPLKKGADVEIYRLRLLKSFPLFQSNITEVSPKRIASWRDYRLQQVSPSTVNRELNLISSIITMAIKEWEIPMAVNPVHMIRRPKNPNSRNRRICMSEQMAIISALGWNGEICPETPRQWVAWGFLVAIETAMRRGELMSMRWRNVHLDERYIHLPSTKNGEERDVPLSSEAIRLFSLLKRGRDDDVLIPLLSGRFTKTFIDAKRSVGLDDIHFHDTRREAATRLSEKLSNVLELSAVTGHKTLSILKVYYRPDVKLLAKKIS